MGKCGPCRHCGVTSTPLWRNGPPDKPVLCNACGSRWRTKGSLVNYTPLHKREEFHLEELKVPRVENISTKPKEEKFLSKQQSITGLEGEYELRYCDQNFRKFIKGDPSNRSSAGSAMSYSESCFGTTEASDITGPAQSNVWDSLVPSKKRTFIARSKPSAVEKLTKELYSILHEQQSSNLSSSDDDLLYESRTQLGSSEIGYGGLLIKNPNSAIVDDESEASSFPADNKLHIIGEVYSTFFPLNNENKGMSSISPGVDKLKNCKTEEICMNTKRDKSEILSLLQDRNSPLGSVDLNNIINFEVFLKYLTNEDQQQLMKHLPSIDTSRLPDSLKSFFKSAQYFETGSCFQRLLQEGVFDLSYSGVNVEDCRILKKHILLDERKSVWVEIRKRMKDKVCKHRKLEKRAPFMPKFSGDTKMVYQKKPNVTLNDNSSELKGVMRSPKRLCRSSPSNIPAICSTKLITSDTCSKLTDETDGVQDNEGACFTRRSPFASYAGQTSMQVPSQFTAESSDHDVLLHLPRHASFPEAELIYLPSKKKGIPNGFHDSGVTEREESLSSFPCSTFTNRQAVIK